MKVIFKSDAKPASGSLVCRFKQAANTTKGKKSAEALALHNLRAVKGVMELELNPLACTNMETDEAWRSTAAASISMAQKLGHSDIIWDIKSGVSHGNFELLIEGLQLFAYQYNRYRSGNDRLNGQLTVVAGKSTAELKKSYDRSKLLFSGVNTARDLANTPANDLPPLKLAELAKEMCRARKLEFKQISAAQLAKQGYIGLTSVGQGSVNPPVMFTMTYKPARVTSKTPSLCFVGKGITFDSGGISIKPWDGMWDMKADMGGAAAVVGIMESIARLRPAVNVVGVVAAAENMPDGNAYRPGDILKYRNGTTVEIRSTDAEGRLVLADALIYAQETLKQKRIVDLATLTGACVRALGHQYIGLLSRSDKLAQLVMKCATVSGEPVWQLPMHPEYRKLLASPIADIRNSGGPLAGASTAGWFLHEFVNEGTEYVHLDIASSFLAPKVDKYWSQPGATGSGVRLCAALAEAVAGS